MHLILNMSVFIFYQLQYCSFLSFLGTIFKFSDDFVCIELELNYINTDDFTSDFDLLNTSISFDPSKVFDKQIIDKNISMIKVCCNHKLKCMNTGYEHTDDITSLLKLIDGKIVSGANDKTIKIWDFNDNFKCIYTLEGHSEGISALLKLNDGKIVSGSYDKSIKIWDPKDNFKCIITREAHSEYITSLLKLKDGKIVSGANDKTIKLWDANDNFKCIYSIKQHSEGITSLLRLNDDKIVSGSKDKIIKIWIL